MSGPVAVQWVATGMRAVVTADVAVVRATTSRRCSSCGKRRVLFSMTVTEMAVGNPEAPWRCAPCWGLR